MAQRLPKSLEFEIVYANASVLHGHTAAEFARAPADGIQFVVVRYDDGSIVKHKGQDEYQFGTAVLPGSWTDTDNYFALRARLHELSSLLSGPRGTIKGISN